MARKLKGSWLDRYAEYTSQSEAPAAYNYWCGVSIIGSALKKNAWIQYGFYKIYPNQYIILVGPPGIGKGASINPVTTMAGRADVINYIPDRITAEKIIEKLSTGFQRISTATTGAGNNAQTHKITTGDSSATIISTELPVFLQASEWMLPLMCEMWDKNEFSYDTKTKNTYVAKDICVSLLGGCVPDYIRKLNRDATAAITGGFTSRCIFVFASEKSQLIPWPQSQIKTQLEDDLINDIQHISTIQGEFTFDKQAQVMWTNQYTSLHKVDEFASEVVIGYTSRMKSHIFKLAMIMSAAESDSKVISAMHLYNAIGICEKVGQTLDLTFRSVGESPIAAAQDRVLAYIELKGIVTFAQIMRANYRHVTDETLRQILYVLVAAGFVTQRNKGNTTEFISTNKAQAKKAGNP
jgi:hypothetical protein